MLESISVNGWVVLSPGCWRGTGNCDCKSIRSNKSDPQLNYFKILLHIKAVVLKSYKLFEFERFVAGLSHADLIFIIKYFGQR